MKIKIISPEKLVFEDEVKLAQLPGINGSFSILNNHAPIISVLAKGNIRLVLKDREEIIPINSGVVESSNNVISILIQ